MRKRLAWAILLAMTATAQAQPYPAPQFSMPATADNSARAATTSWVRGQGFIGPNGDASSATVTVAGGSVARPLSARLAVTFNVLDYGAVPDGATDIGPALRAIAAAMAPGIQSRIVIPSGSFALKSAVVFSGVAPIIEGDGFSAGPGPSGSTGTWITISGTGYTPFTLTGTNARGAIVRNVAFAEVQPAAGPGWAPTAYDYVFRVQSTLGEVTFDNVLMSGVTLGVYADNSGRLDIKSLLGQFFTNAVMIDDCFDIPRIEHLHAWPYWSSNPNVEAWQNANLNAVVLKRVDGIFIGNLFSFTGNSALYLTNGAAGVTTKLYADSIYADQVKYGVLVDAIGANGQFSKITTQHNNVVAGGGAILASSRGLLVTGSGDQFQIGKWRTNSVNGSAIDLQGSNNRVTIDDLWANTFWTTAPGDGTPAITVADTSALNLPANFVEVRGTPFLQGVSPLLLFNATTNGGRSKTTQMNSVCGGSPCNEVRTYDNTAGNPVSVAAIGSDPSVDLQLQAKSSTGSVRLQASGQTVLRADAANASTDDVLVRGGTGTLNLILEGGDANIDLYAQAKGQNGGVRLQANGATTLRTDNPNVGNTDLLIRPGTGAIGVITEGASAQADLMLAAKGTGSVRLQSNGLTSLRVVDPSNGDTSLLVTENLGNATVSPENAANAGDLILAGQGPANGVRVVANGVTILRADSPGAGTSNLLVRSGGGTVALTAEDPGANANIVLNPKGAGTVVVPTVGTQDNSTNAASTAWVRSVMAAGGASGPQGPAGPQGAAGPQGVTGAAGAQGPAGPSASATLTGTTTVSLRGGGKFVVQGTQPGLGQANSGRYLLVASTTSTASARLTTDGAAAGTANCVNPAANTAVSAYVDITGIDSTTGASAARMRFLDVMMLRGATASATTVVNGGSAQSPNGAIGSAAALFAVSADIANGCLNVSVTPPNADAWHWAARITTTEVQ